MADFTVREGRRFGFGCSIDGQLVIDMEFGPGLPFRLTPRQQAQRSYSDGDGVTVQPRSSTRWTLCAPNRRRACQLVITWTRKNWHRLAFRSALCCPVLADEVQ